MSDTGFAPAQERRLMRRRAEQMQRALTGIGMQLDPLPPRDRVVVANLALRQALDEYNAHEQPTMILAE